MNEAERDRLLIRLDERTKLMEERGRLVEGTLFGTPGTNGLLQEIAILKDDMRQRELEANHLRAAVPEVKSAATASARWNSAIISGLVAVVAGVIKTIFFPNT